MKIAFDAKRAAQNRTGLGNYSRFILHLLATYDGDNQYLLYTPNPKKTHLLNDVFKKPPFYLRLPSSLCARMRWRSWGMTNDMIKEDVKLLHGLSNQLPLNIKKAKGIKSIVTIHDLIFLRYPECYKPVDRFIYNYKFRKACENADRIIAMSECTKRDIISFYHIPEEKIDVVYQGCSEFFSKPVSEEVKEAIRKKYKLNRRFVLSVGTIETRKNLMLMAKALMLLPDDITVFAIGKRTPYANTIEAYLKEKGLQNRMRLVSGVSPEELPTLYQTATMLVYPSRFEGFGIPMLEALRSGLPALGCTGSCLEEAGGPHSIYVSPDDEKALADAVLRIWNDEKLRQEMIEKGKQFAENFNERLLFDKLMGIYKKTLES